MVITHFTTKNAAEMGVQEALHKINIEINDLKNQDERLWQQATQNKSDISELKLSVITYIGKAIMPNETKVPERKEQ